MGNRKRWRSWPLSRFPLLFSTKLPVLTGRMFYLGPQCARTAFTVLTVARCASAGMVPAATTSQEPAYAPPAGQDHTAFWVMEATSLKRGVREALSAAYHDILSLNTTMMCLRTIISVMRHCQWLFLGMGTGGERREDRSALWQARFNWDLFWINAPTC